ncbi:MAG: CheY-like chemotaxis protein [Salibacteraceae bacterium]|jgi:CheY-like chemotaxis protein
MKNILIIEDNQTIRENLEELLELSNFQVTTASDGQEGMEAIQKRKPNLIICDVAMPEVNGYQVLEFLKSKPETNKIPFIFITSSAQNKEIKKGVLSRADCYLTKPFQTEELLDTIDKLLS